MGSTGKPDECILSATPRTMSQAIVNPPILWHAPKYLSPSSLVSLKSLKIGKQIFMKYQFQYHKQVLQQYLYTEETDLRPV